MAVCASWSRLPARCGYRDHLRFVMQLYELAATHRQSVQDVQIQADWSPAAGKRQVSLVGFALREGERLANVTETRYSQSAKRH